MELLTSTYKERISGVLSCFDRLIITGTLPQICYAQGMTSYLCGQGERIFNYPKFAEPFKNQLRANAQQIAKDNNIEIEFVAKSHIRKEDLVKKVLDKKGIHTGLVHIISAMEACSSYKPWHDKESGKTSSKVRTVNVCTITSISLTLILVTAMSEFLPGARLNYRYILTGTIY